MTSLTYEDYVTIFGLSFTVAALVFAALYWFTGER